MNRRTIAEQIFLAGIESVLPDRLIAKEMSVKDKNLSIRELKFSLDTIENIYVIGAGKASARMAAEVENILGRRITEGHIIVKYGHSCRLKHIKVTEAGHPIPDSNGYKATKAILKIAGRAKDNDLVICLLSGGGSALLPDFPEGSSPEEINLINHLLVNSGACIQEINAVRKHLSLVKGGQLARAVSPATLVSLILSDVPGDQLDVIASGPTTSDSTTFQNALSVLEKFSLIKSAPAGVLRYLKEGEAGNRAETPKSGDPVFNRTQNIIIGNNSLALESSKKKAAEFGLKTVILNHQLQGDINTVTEYIVETSLRYKSSKVEAKPLCLLFGGEVTVKMTGKGVGGRNQHLALLASVLLRNNAGITILSGGTDGNDGPTDAAGAVVDSNTVAQAMSKNIDALKYLRDFDSYHFFKKTEGHIITGPTMTNVMDIIVVIID
jgi:hydroxypyruvate reductase/glycerate 2-kinase